MSDHCNCAQLQLEVVCVDPMKATRDNLQLLTGVSYSAKMIMWWCESLFS